MTAASPASAVDGGLVWDVGCRLAESPVYDAEHDRLLFVNQDDGELLTYECATGATWRIGLPERVGSIGLCESGRVVVAMNRRVVLFDLARGRVDEVLLSELDEPEGNRFNDGKVGPDGAFWVGTRDVCLDRGPLTSGTACLYRITADGDVTTAASGFAIVNGLAWSGDGRRLYMADSSPGRVDVAAFDPSSGQFGERRELRRFSVAEGLPDGAACDTDGNYWTAAPSAGCVLAVDTSGSVVRRLETPCEAPTMVCFAGPWLFVTAMQQKAGMPNSGRKFNRGGLFRFAAPAIGVAIRRFADG